MILFVFTPLSIKAHSAHYGQYDRARPTYPAAALRAIHDSLPTSGPLTILEPGSGTGIFTRLVLSPPKQYPTFDISTLIGVEPSAGMREAWQKGIDKLPAPATQGKKVESVDGTFDDFSKAGLGKGEADAVIIAQAFHWCPDYEGALVCSLMDEKNQPLTRIARSSFVSEAGPTLDSHLEPGGQTGPLPTQSHLLLRTI